MQRSLEEFQEWLHNPCTKEAMGMLQEKREQLVSGLARNITGHNEFLIEKGRILCIEEVLRDLEELAEDKK